MKNVCFQQRHFFPGEWRDTVPTDDIMTTQSKTVNFFDDSSLCHLTELNGGDDLLSDNFAFNAFSDFHCPRWQINYCRFNF
jgi:hypothetical protein